MAYKKKIRRRRIMLPAALLVVALGVFFLVRFVACPGEKGKLANPQKPVEQTEETKQEEEASEKSAFQKELEALYYYDASKQSRYEKYHKKNPDLTADEVCWRVDAGVDFPPYKKIETIKNTDTLPLLISKHFKLPDDFVPSDLVSYDGSFQMTGETEEAYKKLKSAGVAAGCNFYIVSAYRSISYQRGLYDSYLAADGGDRSVTDTYSARPGHSSHHSGRTIDLAGENGDMEKFGETKSYAWLKDNAYKFGFVFDYTKENKNITGYMPEEWQITFVGKKAASTMRSEDIESIEEYFVKHVIYSAR